MLGLEHIYIIYTNDAGETRITRGGPEGSNLIGTTIGDIEVGDAVYDKKSLDWDEEGDPVHERSEPIIFNTDSEMMEKIELARAEMNRINSEGYEFNDVNLGKLATSEEGIKSLVISNPNGETVIVGADTAQNIFNNLSSFFGRSLRVFLSAVFCLGIFLEGSWASNTKHSKKECLNLTTKDKTFNNSANRIMKLKTVSEFLALFRKVKLEEVSLMFFSSEPKYINNKCFWYIRLEEDHQTHLVFWKALLVDIDGSNIYEEDVELDSYHIIK
jgi:hypothetical protein